MPSSLYWLMHLSIYLIILSSQVELCISQGYYVAMPECYLDKVLLKNEIITNTLKLFILYKVTSQTSSAQVGWIIFLKWFFPLNYLYKNVIQTFYEIKSIMTLHGQMDMWWNYYKKAISLNIFQYTYSLWLIRGYSKMKVISYFLRSFQNVIFTILCRKRYYNLLFYYFPLYSCLWLEGWRGYDL